MVSGAVIVGRPIGPGMIRPFTFGEFIDFQDNCNLGLITYCPVEVAYPGSLEDPLTAYQEGVLLNIIGGDECRTPESFEQDVRERLIFAAKEASRLWSEYSHGNIAKPWESDLAAHKVCWEGLGEGADEGVVWKPYMAVLETYPEKEAGSRYIRLASDLVSRTRDRRIANYTQDQNNRASTAIATIGMRATSDAMG
jgi:hypothetical protein